jgi:hypothetical protein
MSGETVKQADGIYKNKNNNTNYIILLGSWDRIPPGYRVVAFKKKLQLHTTALTTTTTTTITLYYLELKLQLCTTTTTTSTFTTTTTTVSKMLENNNQGCRSIALIGKKLSEQKKAYSGGTH